LSANSKRSDAFIAAELFLINMDALRNVPGFSIGDCWEQVIREPVIPYDPSVRQTKLRKAYENLSEFAPVENSPQAG
jgi:hypothetical protein